MHIITTEVLLVPVEVLGVWKGRGVYGIMPSMKKKTDRIEAAVALRRAGKSPAQIKKLLGIKDWKVMWRIFNVYAKNWDVDNSFSGARQ